MTNKRYPPPFKPLPAIARSTLPGQEKSARRPRPPIVHDEEIHEELQRTAPPGNPVLTITADVTIPRSAGYATRLMNLIASLRGSIEEEAPWLSNVEITVSTSK